MGDQETLRNALIVAWTKGLSSSAFTSALAALNRCAGEAQQTN